MQHNAADILSPRVILGMDIYEDYEIERVI